MAEAVFQLQAELTTDEAQIRAMADKTSETFEKRILPEFKKIGTNLGNTFTTAFNKAVKLEVNTKPVQTQIERLATSIEATLRGATAAATSAFGLLAETAGEAAGQAVESFRNIAIESERQFQIFAAEATLSVNEIAERADLVATDIAEGFIAANNEAAASFEALAAKATGSLAETRAAGAGAAVPTTQVSGVSSAALGASAVAQATSAGAVNTAAGAFTRLAGAETLAERAFAKYTEGLNLQAGASGRILRLAKDEIVADASLAEAKELLRKLQSDFNKELRETQIAMLSVADQERARTLDSFREAAAIETVKAAQQRLNLANEASAKILAPVPPLINRIGNSLKSLALSPLNAVTGLGKSFKALFESLSGGFRVTGSGFNPSFRGNIKGVGDAAKDATGALEGASAAEAGAGEAAASAGPAIAALITLFVAFKASKIISGLAADANKFENALKGVKSEGTLASEGLSKSLSELKLSVGLAFSPAVTQITNTINEGIKNLTPSVIDLAVELRKFVPILEVVIKAGFDLLKISLEGIAETLKFIAAIGGQVAAFFQTLKSVVEATIPGLGTVGDILGFIKDRFTDAFGKGVDPAVTASIQLEADKLQVLKDAGLDSAGALNFTADAVKNLTVALAQARIALLESNSGFQGQLDAIAGVINAYNNLTDAQTKTTENAFLDKLLQTKAAEDAVTAAKKAQKDAQDNLNAAIKKHNDDLAQKQIDLTNSLADASDKLTDAQDKLAEANQKVLDAQAALDLAQQPASVEETGRAEDALASAHLRLRQALIDEKKAQDDLNRTQNVNLDLTGLTVDQIKTRLSVARAALAAQKQAESTPTREDREATLLQATINRKEAEFDLLDAEKEIQDLKKKGSALDPDVVSAAKAVAEAKKQAAQAEKDVAKAIKDQQKAKDDLLKVQKDINSGGKTDLDYQQQIKGLVEARDTATKNIKTTEDALAVARATAINDQTTLNKLKLDELGTTRDILNLISAPGVDASVAARQAVISILPSILAGAKSNLNGLPFTINSDSLKLVGDKILNVTPGADLRTVLRQVLNQLGFSIPGLKSGGYVPGAASALGTLHRLGEYGKAEAVLPLTNATRMQALLSDARILTPVLDALPSPSSPTPSLPSALSGRAGNQAALNRLEKEQDARRIAKAIVAEMQDAGFISGEVKNVEMTVNQTAPHTQLSERELRRAIDKALDF